MKRYIIYVFLFAPIFSISQKVGINTENPIADFEIQYNPKFDTTGVYTEYNLNAMPSGTIDSGIIYDDGGASGDYQNYSNYSRYFSGQNIIYVEYLDCENFYDYLIIGKDTISGMLQDRWYVLENDYLRFASNLIFNRPGFKLKFKKIEIDYPGSVASKQGFKYYAAKKSLYVGKYWEGDIGSGALNIGEENVTSSYSTIALGERNISSGGRAITMGVGNQATHFITTAIGAHCRASNAHAVAIGYNVNTNSNYGFNCGTYNIGFNKSAYELGDGATSSTRSNLITVMKDRSAGYAVDDGILSIGDMFGQNILIDESNIIARNGSGVSDLNLNMVGNAITRINNPYLFNMETTGSYSLLRYNPVNGRLWRETSTRRHKNNIEYLEDDWKKILDAKARTYTRPHLPELQEIGYIAEEMDEIGLDRLVSRDQEGQIDNFDYLKLVVYIIEVLKIHDEDLKRITNLENELVEIKAMLKKP